MNPIGNGLMDNHAPRIGPQWHSPFLALDPMTMFYRKYKNKGYGYANLYLECHRRVEENK